MFFFLGVGELLFDPVSFVIGALSIIPIGFSVIFVIDAHERDAVEPVRLTVFAILATSFIWCLSLPGWLVTNISILGESIFEWRGWFKTLGSFILLLGIILLTIHALKVYRRAKHFSELKRPAQVFLIAILCYWVSIVFASIPLTGHQFFVSISAVLIAKSYSRHRKLFFLLSFKVLRVTIIHNETGIPLFNHTWKSGMEMADDVLYAGMLQGIGLFVQDAINQGNLKELRLVNGVVLLKSSDTHPVTCALAATRSSRVLKNALDLFIRRFVEQFKDALAHPENCTPFASASQLLEDCFPFVAEYDN